MDPAEVSYDWRRATTQGPTSRQRDRTIPDKNAQARGLAEAHCRYEGGVTAVFGISGGADVEVRPDEPIKLLEVNENTIPTGVMPLYFDAAPERGIHFPTVVMEVTPNEFEKIKSNELKLPPGWFLDDPIPNDVETSTE